MWLIIIIRKRPLAVSFSLFIHFIVTFFLSLFEFKCKFFFVNNKLQGRSRLDNGCIDIKTLQEVDSIVWLWLLLYLSFSPFFYFEKSFCVRISKLSPSIDEIVSLVADSNSEAGR